MTRDLAKQLVDVRNCSGRMVDKLVKFGLVAIKDSQMKAPMIAEYHASLECRVTDTRRVNRYNFSSSSWRCLRRGIDTAVRKLQTLHRRGNGVFAVADAATRSRSAMK